MNTLKSVFIILLLPLTLSSFGQSKEVWLATADDFFTNKDYASALKYYQLMLDDSVSMQTRVLPYEVAMTNQKLKEKKLEIDSTFMVSRWDYVNHQIAMCYHLTYDYSHAVEQFKLTSETAVYKDDKYYYARALIGMERYEDALRVLEEYTAMEDINADLEVQAHLDKAGCKYATLPSTMKKEVTVTMADTGTFNKGSTAFAPMYWGGSHRLIFTSAREGGVVFDPEQQQSEFLCDLYWAEKMDEDTWSEAKNFGRPLNSAQHDASGCISINDVVYYTRWSDEERGEQHIYLARMKNMLFYEAFKLDSAVNIPGYRSINPYVTPSGKWLYFSSNRPGGKGGMDIWKIRLDENGNTSGNPINLGTPVNSSADEVTPFYHRKTLFFSSDGHKSMGGLDIFKATYDSEVRNFRPPVNMGAPINSSKDDAYMVWDEYFQNGWFSSDREPCEAGHCYDLYQVKNAPIVIKIEGYVYDANTYEIIPDANVTFKDVNYNFEPFVLQSDATGFYQTELQQDIEVFIKSQKESYFADAASADTRYISQSTTLEQDFYLNQIPQEEIEIPGIEYDFDSEGLRPRSMEILDELYEFLVLNDNLVVQINSHTDARGDAGYNQNLSERRAKSCVDYLISKGIPAERLIAKGYGESEPSYLLDENKDPVLDADGNKIPISPEYIAKQPTIRKKEELHQRNRRTAFKVVGEGFVLESTQ